MGDQVKVSGTGWVKHGYKRPRLRLVWNTTMTDKTTEPLGYVSVSFDPCLAKREPDESMFILLARDPVAPDVLEAWCEMRSGSRPWNAA